MQSPFANLVRRLGLGLLGLAAACSTPDLFSDNRLTLESADKRLAAGEFDAVMAPLEDLVLRTNADPEPFALQRYFAVYLLSRANAEASVRTGGDDWLSNLTAAAYYMNYALEWSKAAKASGPKAEDGAVLLPASLSSYGLEKTQTYLDLAWVVICARAKFQGEVAEVLGREPRLLSVLDTEALSREVGMSDEMRPWLLWSVYEYQKSHGDEPAAYKFGIRARELGRQVPRAFPSQMGDQIVRWILNDSKYVFKSSAGVAFDPGSEVCSQTGEPNISFQGEMKK